MRWAIAAITCVLACGARSEIAGDDFLDASTAADVAIDIGNSTKDVGAGAHDASTDAAPDAALCCDDGLKVNGCQTCASGQTCISKMGSCVVTVTNCGPSNCNGCCLNATLCADGITAGACGNHGQWCQTCIDTKTNKYSSCIPDGDGLGGTCIGGPTCTPQNCGQGCCNGDICMFGIQDDLCGHSGVACADCAAQGGTCDNHECKLPHQ